MNPLDWPLGYIAAWLAVAVVASVMLGKHLKRQRLADRLRPPPRPITEKPDNEWERRESMGLMLLELRKRGVLPGLLSDIRAANNWDLTLDVYRLSAASIVHLNQAYRHLAVHRGQPIP